MSIRLFSNGKEVKVSFSTFPGGEEHVRILEDISDSNRLKIHAKIWDSSQLMRLMVLDRAIQDNYGKKYELHIPYLPYARQDRVCNKGEAHSLNMMLDIISRLNISFVYVYDVHNPEAVDWHVYNRLIHVEQVHCITKNTNLKQFIDKENVVLVSPDKGSRDKIRTFKEYFGKEIIYCDKVRNPVTTDILDTVVHGDIDENKHYLIIDDICDGGRTFIEIAKKLKQAGANDISLYVTHGIFSKGFSVFEGLFKSIWTTNSFYDRMIGSYKGIEVNQFNIFSIMEEYPCIK